MPRYNDATKLRDKLQENCLVYSSQNQVLIFARFNEEDTIFQLYSRVIIVSCHKDVTLTAFIPKLISIRYKYYTYKYCKCNILVTRHDYDSGIELKYCTLPPNLGSAVISILGLAFFLVYSKLSDGSGF